MIDYAHLLNEAQFAAASLGDGPALVVAGAGSGKTRTIVYRLSWLLEHGVDPGSILLLTFTRKAAQEMLDRARALAGGDLAGLGGGTFHSFAYGVLRRHHPLWLGERSFTVMDSGDQLAAIRLCREDLALARGVRGFPKAAAIVALFSRARNKELSLEALLEREAQHLLPLLADLAKLEEAYAAFKREKAVLDYDDLLFELEALLLQDKELADSLSRRYRHILVDEYQDTNLVQARLVRLLSGVDRGLPGSVMAVGDEAQSIYSFRGATVRNILSFPDLFPGTRVVTIEENYRSTAPILAVANAVLAHAAEGYHKQLFTRRKGGDPVRLYRCFSDRSQAGVVLGHIRELLGRYAPNEIAVLFRSGYQSFPLELALVKQGLRFGKYGGLKYSEASHVKDLLAYLKLMVNPSDFTSFSRIAGFFKGIGPKTSARLFALLGEGEGDEKALAKYRARFPEFFAELAQVEDLAAREKDVTRLVRSVIEIYRPHLEELYPENHPRRLQALEAVVTLSLDYTALDLFLADLMLDSPEETADDGSSLVLSTIHSAKGLEWKAVLLIDLAEDRFPSRHAGGNLAAFEEERRLMYVACTRAREVLRLYSPMAVTERGGFATMPVSPSPFLRELPEGLVETYREGYGGRMHRESGPTCSSFMPAPRPARPGPAGSASTGWADEDFSQEEPAPRRAQAPGRPAPDAGSVRPDPVDCRAGGEGGGVPASRALDAIADGRVHHCIHRLFGRGRVLSVHEDRVTLDFPGYGVKTIVADFLVAEVPHA